MFCRNKINIKRAQTLSTINNSRVQSVVEDFAFESAKQSFNGEIYDSAYELSLLGFEIRSAASPTAHSHKEKFFFYRDFKSQKSGGLCIRFLRSFIINIPHGFVLLSITVSK